MQPQTHPEPTPRVLVVATGDVAAVDHVQMHELTASVRGRHVRVVAPALAVAGERWIIDLTAREAQARRRLEAWRLALEPHARLVETEIGDEDAQLALADTQREFEPDTVLATMPPAEPAPKQLLAALRRWWQEQPAAGALPFAA